MKKKDCMFQYAVAYKYRNADIIEDTDLITLDEAKELWQKYLPNFVTLMQDNEGDPEMVIWIDCENNHSYRKSLAHIDRGNEVINGIVYEIYRKEVIV